MTADLEAASLAILENIPITAAMGVRVVKLEPGSGSIEAPPEPNINHAGMMYAGSLFTLGELLGGLLPRAATNAGYDPGAEQDPFLLGATGYDPGVGTLLMQGVAYR